MEPNPYESPQTGQPLVRTQIIKRSVGLAAVLLLTPPAMAIAVLAGCQAARWVPLSPSLIALGIPGGILVGLMILAGLVHRPQKYDPNRVRHNLGIFLFATPFFVGLAAVVGFALAALTYLAGGTQGGGMALWAQWTMAPAFWLPPAATFLLMLWLAWRNR